MIDIAFINETDSDTAPYELIIRDVFEETMRLEEIDQFYEVSVIFVSDEKIRDINREYRQIDKVTDVISFALLDEADPIENHEISTLGDIFISVNKAHGQALDYGHSINREIGFLACHGLLHLLGYDHMSTEEESEMFQKQEQILTNCQLRRIKEDL